MSLREDPGHREWLDAECRRLLAFGARVVHPLGGAAWLDDRGRPDLDQGIRTWITARTVHVNSLGVLLGVPGSADLAAGALAGLTGPLHDADHGGWFTAASPERSPRPGRGQVRLRPRLRDAGRVERRAGGHRGSGGPAGGGRDGLRGAVLGRGVRPLRRPVGRVLAAGRPLPRPQREHARGRGDARGRGRHRSYDVARARRPDRRLRGRPGRCPRRAAARALRRDVDPRPRAQPRPARRRRSSPSARRSATRWSGHGCCSTSRHRSGPTPRTRCCPPRSSSSTVRSPTAGRATVRPASSTPPTGTAAPSSVRGCTGWRPRRSPRRPRCTSGRERRRTTTTTARGGSHVVDHVVDLEAGSWHHELDPANRPAASVWPGKPDLYHAVQATLLPRLPLGRRAWPAPCTPAP